MSYVRPGFTKGGAVVSFCPQWYFCLAVSANGRQDSIRNTPIVLLLDLHVHFIHIPLAAIHHH